MKKFHPNHMVEQSPWPILSSLTGFSTLMSATLFWHKKISFMTLTTSLLITMMVAASWAHDIFNEAAKQGSHSKETATSLKAGMILFITSEVFLFISFFWAFFNSSMCPNPDMGSMWPPKGISYFDPFMVPLLNTIILVSSGASLTWSHEAIHSNNIKKASLNLMITIAMGVTFSFFQGMEYWNAEFCLSDSSYGSSFFMATGFHGLHVIIGSILLLISLNQLSKLNSSWDQFISFDTAAWYWHFVDVVWLFLFTSMYWWGS